MKILLFNLGSTANRISSWGIEGFNSLFEQDVILWGPVPDQQFSFVNKEIPVIRVFEETSIKEIFKRLPENWYPDIVVCDTSVINYIPDIYLCPVKTILFTRDAWADTLYNREIVEFFDFINYGIVDRALYNSFRVNVLPLSNCAVSLPDSTADITPYKKRKIDVISIVNFNSGFYHGRYKTLYRLSYLNNKGINIKYVSGIKRKAINRYYQNSKIVLDWAHTLSNRSYEAALNGCLLFSHEDNPVLKTFWIPFVEYVPYNESNLLELITHYLVNTEEAEKIIKNSYEKVLNVPSSMGQSYWEQISIAHKTDVNVSERIRRNESLPPAVLHYRQATPLVYNYNYKTHFPGNWKEVYFRRIDASIASSSDSDQAVLPLIEACRLAFLLNDNDLSEKYLARLEKTLPDYAWLWYLRARQDFARDEHDRALEYADKAIDCCIRAPELIQKYILPLNEKQNSCDGRRITDYMWKVVYNHNNEFQVKCLFHLSNELRGDIFKIKDLKNDAIKAYEQAFSYIPLPRCSGKLSRLLLDIGDCSTLLSIYEQGLDDSPYYTDLILCSAYALYMDGKSRTAYKLLADHRKALRSFLGKRRMTLTRRSITWLLVIRIFGKTVFVNSLLYFLKMLEKGNPE